MGKSGRRYRPFSLNKEVKEAKYGKIQFPPEFSIQGKNL
jgi:hypothetical protein